MRRRAFLLHALLLVVMSTRAWAADLPVNFQAVFLLRVLAYDRNLKTRTGEAASILLVYQEGNDPSATAKSDMLAAIAKIGKDAKVADLPIRVSAFAYSNPDGLDAAISNAKASAIYLCPGLDASVGAISDVSRRRSVLSFTGIEPWVKERLSIALVARDAKPAIVVNLPASKAEGADLDPALLRLAEVIR
jgi:hypothetical protein